MFREIASTMYSRDTAKKLRSVYVNTYTRLSTIVGQCTIKDNIKSQVRVQYNNKSKWAIKARTVGVSNIFFSFATGKYIAVAHKTGY